MNRTYALVWNPSLATWSVTDEHARQRGKGAGAILAAALLLPLTAIAADLPSGGNVVAGSGQIKTPSANQMVIDQTSNKLAIDWQSFDIAAGHKVTFNQPGSDSIALNRVLGADGSKIMGQLDANGRVFLINPNGVLFGAGAQVNVGGLVASTLNISDSDFAAGNYKFKGNGSNASVINKGHITAADGGSIALLGGTVSNNGVIVANQGTVALAAGNAVTLDFAGDGLLNVQVDEAVVDALVENHQLIKADGGQVMLTANAGDALLKTVVNNTGVIEAQTLGEKDGKIVLLGSFDGGTVQVAGTLDASAPNGGNGGFIETSGAHVKVADSAHVTTKAASGKTGTWLIDPNDFNIAANGGDMTGAAVSTAVQDNNFEIQTATQGTSGGSGDIHVNDAITWTSDNTLTLNAERNININAAITADAQGKVALKYGQASADGGTADYHIAAPINLQSGQNFSTQKGSVGSVVTYSVVNDAAALQAMNNGLGSNYAVGSDIDLSSITNWQPVGNDSSKFTGQFAGLGHTLSNLTSNRSDTNYIGLFGATSSDSVIRDVGLVGGSVTGAYGVGGLVGLSRGTISNAYATGSADGQVGVGGLVGLQVGGSISNAYATGSVTGSSEWVGGLVGYNSGTIRNAHASGSVLGSLANSGILGGLIGSNSGTVSDVYATGNVNGNNDIGGLIGHNEGAISNASAIGSVNGNTHVGGLIGSSVGDIGNAHANGNVVGNNDVGGLVGKHYSGTISNAYATGGVKSNTGAYTSVGGLVGSSSGAINNAYATGNVEGIKYVGGLVGSNDGTISNAYATGSVDGIIGAGGLVGIQLKGSISNAYATGRVKGYNDVGGLVGANDGTINYAYATGSVKGDQGVGGLVGVQNKGSTSNSFYATTAVNNDEINQGGTTDWFSGNAYGTGKTWAELTHASTFTDWSIASTGGSSATWRIYDGYSGPLLRSFLQSVTLTASASGGSKIYDGTAATGTTTYTNSSLGSNLDTSKILGTLGYRSNSKNAGTYNSTDGALTLSGLYSGQQGYDISYADTSLSIAQKALTITANNASKTVGQSIDLSGYTTSGLVGGDSINALSLSSLGQPTTAAVGDYAIVASDAVGAALSNYIINYQDGTLLVRAAASEPTTASTPPYIGVLASNGQSFSTQAPQQASEPEFKNPQTLMTNPLAEVTNLQVINQGIRLPEGI